jgi:biotin operon repressor
MALRKLPVTEGRAKQGELGTTAPFVSGSDTSQDAAASMADRVGQTRQKVYESIATSLSKGQTCDEAEEALEMTHQTVSARIKELKDTGYIVDTGDRRKTRSKQKAAVYVATEFLTPVMLQTMLVSQRKPWKTITLGEVAAEFAPGGFSIRKEGFGFKVSIHGAEHECQSFEVALSLVGAIAAESQAKVIEAKAMELCGKGKYNS